MPSIAPLVGRGHRALFCVLTAVSVYLFFWQHGEIIESSYLLGEKGPKSTWTRILEVVVVLATIGGCAYLMLFLFHHGNHHSPEKDSPSHPHAPVGASSSTSKDDAACHNHPACIGELPRPSCVFDFLSCTLAVLALNSFLV